MIKVLRRRGINLLFLNITDSCSVKVKDRLYFHAGKIAHYSYTYKNVNLTDSLLPSGCNGPQNNKSNCSLFFDT